MAETSPVSFSRFTTVDELPDAGLRVTIETCPEERAALARLNGLPDLPHLEAAFTLRREGQGGVWVSGEVQARVVQTCVVSLEPFETEVIEPIDVHYLPEALLQSFRAARAQRRAEAADPDEGDPDEPDLIEHGRIDLGALAAEHLALGLDPYPRKPGVLFAEPTATSDLAEDSPFGVLKVLKGDTP